MSRRILTKQLRKPNYYQRNDLKTIDLVLCADAMAADEAYVKKEGDANCYTGYRIHNMHFVAYSAMFAGD
jgi:hypothetical protein